MNIIKDFNEFFETLKNDNRIAYLSLTSKNESQIRDNFAFFLNEKYNNKNYIAREYSFPNQNRNRADLVILNLKGNPEIIIELKACFAFTLEKNIQQYVEKIGDDRSKYFRIKEVKKYYILLVTNPYNLPTPKIIFDKIIKRYRRMEIFIENNSPEKYFDKAQTVMNNAFSKTALKITFSKDIKLGKAFNVECGLYCFILEEK